MNYRDISVPIHPAMPVYEGDPPVEITLAASIEKGDAATVSCLRMGAHTGTHIDAPRHFIAGGRGVDEIPLGVLIGRARVLHVPVTGEISRGALAAAGLKGEERVLLRTSNSGLWREDRFRKEFVSIGPDAAAYLVEIGVKLVGIDYLSVERFGTLEPETHRTLLRAGVVILEGLNLSDIQPGCYELVCLPLRIKGCDGSPCRAVLIED
jgi:arylformamidase